MQHFNYRTTSTRRENVEFDWLDPETDDTYRINVDVEWDGDDTWASVNWATDLDTNETVDIWPYSMADFRRRAEAAAIDHLYSNPPGQSAPASDWPEWLNDPDYILQSMVYDPTEEPDKSLEFEIG